MKAPQLSRKEREYQERRRYILETALKLFSERGFHDVTMQEIAKASEFSVGTLYNFFANKEALYLQLVDEKIDDFYADLKQSLNGPGTEMDRLTAWLDAKIRVYRENIDHIRFYFSEKMMGPLTLRTAIREKSREQQKSLMDAIASVFQSGIDKGVFEKGDAYCYAVAIDGMAGNLIYESIDNPERVLIKSDALLDLFLKPVSKQ